MERVKATDSVQNLCGSHFARRLQAIAIPLQATEGADRTPRRTHTFLSLVGVPHLIALFTRACVRVAQVKLVT